jgi:hypothetical protein
MTTPLRVLTGIERYGTRRITVDAQGNGDHTSIQAALTAAHSQFPASDSRWLVLIAPGEYQEALTLYDYVDISGLAPGYSSHLLSPPNQAAITNGADCTVSNLRIDGDYDPLIQTGASFSNTLRMVNCLSDYANAEVTFIQLITGTLELWNCSFKGGGKLIYAPAASTASLIAYNSLFHHAHSDSGASAEPAIHIAGAAALEMHACRVLNSAASGGAALKITASPASLVFHHCLFRKASGSYSLDTTVTPTAYLGACTANAPLNPAITGTHDVEVDGNY